MVILLLLVCIVPGIIASFVSNSINRNKDQSISRILLNWIVFSYFIFLTYYAVLYIKDKNDVIKIALREGADLYRVSFMIKSMVLLLILSFLLPILMNLLLKIKDAISIFFIQKIKKRNFFSILSNQSLEENFIIRMTNLCLNSSESEFKKLASLRDSTLIRKGKICIFSPIYNLYFKSGTPINIFEKKENFEKIEFTNKDTLLIISNEKKDIEVFKNYPNVFFIFNEIQKELDEKRTITMHLFRYQNSNERKIENVMLQGILTFLLS